MFELSAFFFRTSRRKYFSAVANVEQHRNGAELIGTWDAISNQYYSVGNYPVVKKK